VSYTAMHRAVQEGEAIRRAPDIVWMMKLLLAEAMFRATDAKILEHFPHGKPTIEAGFAAGLLPWQVIDSDILWDALHRDRLTAEVRDARWERVMRRWATKHPSRGTLKFLHGTTLKFGPDVTVLSGGSRGGKTLGGCERLQEAINQQMEEALAVPCSAGSFQLPTWRDRLRAWFRWHILRRRPLGPWDYIKGKLLYTEPPKVRWPVDGPQARAICYDPYTGGGVSTCSSTSNESRTPGSRDSETE
jgi:hypothetical protein